MMDERVVVVGGVMSAALLEALLKNGFAVMEETLPTDYLIKLRSDLVPVIEGEVVTVKRHGPPARGKKGKIKRW